jgi:hypothetical protein
MQLKNEMSSKQEKQIFKLDLEAVQKEKEGQEKILALLQDTNRDSTPDVDDEEEDRPFETALKAQLEELEMKKIEPKPSSPERYQKLSMI